MTLRQGLGARQELKEDGRTQASRLGTLCLSLSPLPARRVHRGCFPHPIAALRGSRRPELYQLPGTLSSVNEIPWVSCSPEMP